jgi:hypothetical protein
VKCSSIIVDTTSLEARTGASATANLWLEIDGREFPCRGWNDFVVVVLAWWARALLRLFRGTSEKERVNFMDGPYAVEVSGPSSDTFWFRAIEGVERNHETASGGAPAVEFAVSLIVQGREVLEACKQRGWWSSDAVALASSLNLLEQECGRADQRNPVPSEN